MVFSAQTENDLLPVVQHLASLAQQHTVFTFTGNLGAGKTTLIKHFCKQMGVEGNVSSPTFGLVNEYETTNGSTIYHFDCYRMKSPAEAYDIGFEEYIDSGNICLIEWPEIIEEFLPLNYISINITLLPNGSRQFDIQVQS